MESINNNPNNFTLLLLLTGILGSTSNSSTSVDEEVSEVVGEGWCVVDICVGTVCDLL